MDKENEELAQEMEQQTVPVPTQPKQEIQVNENQETAAAGQATMEVVIETEDVSEETEAPFVLYVPNFEHLWSVNDDVIGFKRATKTEYPSLYLTAPGSRQTTSPYNFLLDGMELTDEDKVDGTLFTITFTIKDPDAVGVFDINMSYVEGDISDENYEYLDVAIENGKITIK